MSELPEVAAVPVVDGERPFPPGAEQQPAVASCEDGDATAIERNELARLRRALVWIDRLLEPVGPDTLDALGLVIPDDGWGIDIPDGVTAEQFINGADRQGSDA